MAGFLGLGGGSESFFLDDDEAKSMGDIDYMRKPIKVKRTFAKTKGWGDVGVSEKSISAYSETGGDAPESTSGSYGYSAPSYSAPATPSYSAPATPTYTAPATPTYTAPEPAAAPAPTEAVAESTPAPEAAPKPAPAPSSSGSDGMDMFRDMARKIR